MDRRIWLIATVTALFALQAPLCAFACLQDTSGQPIASAEAPAAPCHEPDPSSHSSAPASSRDECGCDDLPTVVPTADTTLSSAVAGVAILPPSPPSEITALPQWRARVQTGEIDLPPPDILLLKSTLLL